MNEYHLLGWGGDPPPPAFEMCARMIDSVMMGTEKYPSLRCGQKIPPPYLPAREVYCGVNVLCSLNLTTFAMNLVCVQKLVAPNDQGGHKTTTLHKK